MLYLIESSLEARMPCVWRHLSNTCKPYPAAQLHVAVLRGGSNSFSICCTCAGALPTTQLSTHRPPPPGQASALNHELGLSPGIHQGRFMTSKALKAINDAERHCCPFKEQLARFEPGSRQAGLGMTVGNEGFQADLAVPQLAIRHGSTAGRQMDGPGRGVHAHVRKYFDAGRPAIRRSMVQARSVVAVGHKWAGCQVH